MNNISSRTLYQLQLLADSLKTNPDYLAWVFASYQKIERISTAKLIQIFGVSPTEFSKIALCKRPAAESSDFAQQVKQIANNSNTDPALLANIIRQVDCVQALFSKSEALTQGGQDTYSTQFRAGLLTAARDHSVREQAPDYEPTATTNEEERRRGDDLIDE